MNGILLCSTENWNAHSKPAMGALGGKRPPSFGHQTRRSRRTFIDKPRSGGHVKMADIDVDVRILWVS